MRAGLLQGSRIQLGAPTALRPRSSRTDRWRFCLPHWLPRKTGHHRQEYLGIYISGGKRWPVRNPSLQRDHINHLLFLLQMLASKKQWIHRSLLEMNEISCEAINSSIGSSYIVFFVVAWLTFLFLTYSYLTFKSCLLGNSAILVTSYCIINFPKCSGLREKLFVVWWVYGMPGQF